MTSSTSSASSAILEDFTDIFSRRFIYDCDDASYTQIPQERLQRGQNEPPDHCHACVMVSEKEEESIPRKIDHGVAWKGVKYHVHDTVMIKAQEGPCNIGQIFRIHFAQSDDDNSVFVRVKLFGRIDKLGLRPAEELKHEVRTHNSHANLTLIYVSQRHLFVTQSEMTVPMFNVLGLCQVYVRASIPELTAWLEISPYHFYACYAFPSLNVTSWNDRQKLEPRDLLVCRYCAAEDLAAWKDSREFVKKHKPLRALDPFAGSGSFALGMEETGCVKVTHAIEISPSAAKTLKYAFFSFFFLPMLQQGFFIELTLLIRWSITNAAT